MYYNKKQLEQMRIEGEKIAKEMERKRLGLGYKAGGIQVTCLHCKHDKFHKGEGMLNTRVLTFFDLDWLDESATILVCANCGFIHWFGKEVEDSKE